jgi:EmrB/QacA subfamily drug resistance transporter
MTKSNVIPPHLENFAQAATAACTPSNRKWVLAATVLGSALAFMDGSVVNIALPTLQTSFRATSGQIQWVVQSYALFGSALLLFGGALGDRFGRRRCFAWGVALFTLASALCAISQSLGQLVLARSIQGVGAALLVPQGLSIISVSFPAGERGKAIGTWSAWTSVFAALGPVAGGWLIQAWSWRLIFLLNLPFALLIFLLLPKIPESKAEQENAQPLDRLGVTLSILGFAAIVYALSFAPELGWRNARILCALFVGIVLLAGFLKSQIGRASAIMPLSLFRNPQFFTANLLTLLLYGALGGALYVIPFYVIQIRHYTPTEAGSVFIPLIAMMFLFSSRIGSLVPKFGAKPFLFAGPLLVGFGFIALTLLEKRSGYTTALFPGVFLLGAGMTLAVAPLTTTVMASVPPEMTGIASAVNNAISRLAALVSVSLLALLLAHGFEDRLTQKLNLANLPGSAKQAMVSNQHRLHDIPVPQGLNTQEKLEVAAILDEAFLSGFRKVMFASALATWAGALVVLFLFDNSAKTPVR